MRQGKLVHDYNFRSYAIRRVKTGFEESRGLTGCVECRDSFYKCRPSQLWHFLTDFILVVTHTYLPMIPFIYLLRQGRSYCSHKRW